MFTFYFDTKHYLQTGDVPLFMCFYVYVWLLWCAKVAIASRYRPYQDPGGVTADLTTAVIVPVYNESEIVFRRVLRSVKANAPTELIVVVDGADRDLMASAQGYADQVVGIAKSGKREAIQVGASLASAADIYVVLDSDTVWAQDTLAELLKPFADSRVGGVTPRQRISQPRLNAIRRTADWIEDLRYSLTAPAQSVFGQVGCLAGRTIAYRREAFLAALEPLVNERVLGVPMMVGDDRVLTNELLRRDWRTVLQSTSVVETEAPDTWRLFWRQQLRWGRSSQRETFLSARWLWRKPVAATVFVSDMAMPFLVFALVVGSLIRAGQGRAEIGPHVIWPLLLLIAVVGMTIGMGVRQIPHLRRAPADLLRLPLFVLQLTLFMTPIRLIAFATMFHNNWGTRPAAPAAALEPAVPHHALSQHASAVGVPAVAASSGVASWLHTRQPEASEVTT